MSAPMPPLWMLPTRDDQPNPAGSYFSELIQYIMMSNIKEQDQPVLFVIPDDPNIHIHTAFEKIFRSLYPFCTQRRVKGILR